MTERVVVSRYRRTSVAEHGVVLDGWQYELFVVDVDPAGLPAGPPKRASHPRTVDPRLVPESLRPVVAQPPAATAEIGTPVLHAEARARLSELDWVTRLADRPGWRWDIEAERLRCPANQLLRLSSVVQPPGEGKGLAKHAQFDNPR